PSASGFFLHSLIAHARERRIVLGRRDGQFRRSRHYAVIRRSWVCSLDDMRAGGGVRFTRLLHSSANEALEILVARHRQSPLGTPRATPQQRANGDAKT